MGKDESCSGSSGVESKNRGKVGEWGWMGGDRGLALV